MRSRKGVSEIIAVILMILIVTSIGFGVFLYALGYFSNITSAYTESSRLDSNAVRENFAITDVLFTVSGGETTIRVAVYNYGTTNLRIAAVYINGTPVSGLSDPGAIPPFSWAYVTGKFPPIGAGEPQLVRVVSRLGNYYENYYYYEGP